MSVRPPWQPDPADHDHYWAIRRQATDALTDALLAWWYDVDDDAKRRHAHKVTTLIAELSPAEMTAMIASLLAPEARAAADIVQDKAKRALANDCAF